MKTPVITSKDYIVYLEIVKGLYFIHMDVYRWTKTIKQQFLKDWNQWTQQQKGTSLFAMPFIDDAKMEKWVAMTGFKLLENHLCTDGVVRKLYKWSK